MACFRLFTLPPLPPLPDLSVPFFLRCIALSTDLLADFPYFRPWELFFLAGIFLSFHRGRMPPIFASCTVRQPSEARLSRKVLWVFSCVTGNIVAASAGGSDISDRD